MKLDGFMAHIGPLMRRRDVSGAPEYGLQTDATHQNRIGCVHGGVIATLLDQVIAIEAWKAVGQQPVVTVQMDVRFIGAATAGDFLRARASLRHVARSLIFADAEIACGEVLVATATAVMKVSKNAG
ncbi:PaaI family thioesterase [Phaeovulum sp. W22_SRMD_FR3]|uniref:PaaI family thioesterase n=1 Tax=Phaeovulum sp. W22_SRMD_FR3 TaxID=3240274 RepID=UPI003F99B2F0